MEVRSYNNELVFAQLLFSRVFKNITIRRKLGDGKSLDIRIPCVIGSRSRVYKNIEAKSNSSSGNLTLPLICITRTGLSKSPERLSNLHNEIVQSDGVRVNYNLLTPIPIDIHYEVAVISKYPADAEMVMSNFIPFFNQDIYVSSIHPKFKNIKTNSQIIMDDEISQEFPAIEGVDGLTDDIQTSVCTFTFKTWIFGGTAKSKYNGYLGNLSAEGRVLSSYPGDDSDGDGSSAEDTANIKEIRAVSVGFYAVPTSSDFTDYFRRTDLSSSDPDYLYPDADFLYYRYDSDGIKWIIE